MGAGALWLCACVCAGAGAGAARGGYTLVDAGEELSGARYIPTWSSLDTRPLPQWYDAAKLGVFLHWGVFSVPSYGSEWFWSNLHENNTRYTKFMKHNYPPGFTYQDFAHMLSAEFFDPDKWADLFHKAGFKYVVLTSKHHEGFTLFPSKRSFSWNSVDLGPKRDLVGDLAKAVRAKGLKFGVYHSLYEWFNPIYLEDKKASFKTRDYPDIKLWPDIKQLVNDYEPSVLWADGDWEALDTYWNSTSLLAWLYNDSPVRDEIVVNDRWGIGIPCHHGDFYNCADRYNPGVLLGHKWENAFTVDKKSWGFRRNAALEEIMTIDALLREVVTSVSCGGNALVNVGPTKEGTISPIYQERLLQLGAWLNLNGEAIYDSSPWMRQNDTHNPEDVWYTCSKATYNGYMPTARPKSTDKIKAIYAVVLKWPKDNVLVLKDVTMYIGNVTKVQLMGNAGYLHGYGLSSTQGVDYRLPWDNHGRELPNHTYDKLIIYSQRNPVRGRPATHNLHGGWHVKRGFLSVEFPDLSTVKSKHAWTLKFTQTTMKG